MQYFMFTLTQATQTKFINCLLGSGSFNIFNTAQGCIHMWHKQAKHRVLYLKFAGPVKKYINTIIFAARVSHPIYQQRVHTDQLACKRGRRLDIDAICIKEINTEPSFAVIYPALM